MARRKKTEQQPTEVKETTDVNEIKAEDQEQEVL